MTESIKSVARRNPAYEEAIRHRFLKRILIFAMTVTIRHGGELPRVPADFSFRKVRSLCNFGGFTFHVDTKQSVAGGNSVQIWHQPDPHCRQIGPTVLDAYWFDDIDDFIIRRLDPNPRWQYEIIKTIRCQKRIGNNFERDRIESERRARKAREKVVKRQLAEEKKRQWGAERYLARQQST